MPSHTTFTTLIDADDLRFRITPIQQVLASCNGAFITSMLMTPLDVVKIRLQTQQSLINLQQSNPKYTGTVDAFKKIARIEGIGSLWSGLGPTLLLAIPSTVIYFVSYEQMRIALKDAYNKKLRQSQNSKTDTKVQPLWIPLCSGSCARIVAATTVSPLELVRTKMQSQRLTYAEVNVALKSLVYYHGIPGLWLGLHSNLMRDVPFSAIYWVHYEALKNMWGPSPGQSTFWFSFFAGAVSGSLAASITVPFDVIKTHQQIELGVIDPEKPVRQFSRSLYILRRIIDLHGYRGLFAGLTPRLVKVVPACAIMIGSFEYGKTFFIQKQLDPAILAPAIIPIKNGKGH